MWLSKLDINVTRRQARHLLASPQRIHAAVLAGFPESPEDDTEKAGRVLWRVDEGAHDHNLYVMSPQEPDLTHLVESVGRPTHGWQSKPYEPLLARLSTGQTWAFRLLGNPTHSVPRPEGGRGKRLGHVTAAQQMAWMHRQAEHHGFALTQGSAGAPDVIVRARRTLQFRRGERTVTLSTALFEGNLQVHDADALRQALIRGVGPAKGYGCGLLTLAAPR